MAGGTGDITLKACARAGRLAATLSISARRWWRSAASASADAGLSDRVAFSIGNAEALPFPDKSFDAYTIAFGIRNVTHIDRALAEAYRVLKTGGRFLCLEFSACEVPLLDRLYDFHSFEVIPRLGATGRRRRPSPTSYLVESIRKFPKQEPFAGMIRAAGFARVCYRNLTGGIAAIHSGWRI